MVVKGECGQGSERHSFAQASPFQAIFSTPFSLLSVMVSSSKSFIPIGICLGTEQGPEEAARCRGDAVRLRGRLTLQIWA